MKVAVADYELGGTMAEIEGKEHKLDNIFSNEFAFEIPLYQRPYRWEQQHAEDLLDDLLTAIATPGAVVGIDPYFLGSIVLVKKKHEARAEVLDGQQRLTTLTLLFACLRATVEAEFGEGLTTFLYEKGSKVKNTKDRYRLQLRDRDQGFFEKYVLSEGGLGELEKAKPSTESQQNLKQNALRFLGRLGKLSEPDRQRLASFMVSNCFLVAVSTPDFVSAYRIFSVLNDRGLDLSHTDILKADVIGEMPEGEREKYTKKWEDLEQALKGEAFEQLFSQLRMIVMKTKLRASILKELRENVKPAANPVKFVDDMLIPLGEAYRELLAGDVEFDGDEASGGDVNAMIGWLRRIEHSEWEAPAIEFLRKHRTAGKACAKFYVALERLAAGLMILRATRDQRTSRYGAVLKAMEDGSDLYAEASPLSLKKDERAKVVAELDKDLYHTGTLAVVTSYVLLRLDSALAAAGASYDLKTISVEHVLPQTPVPGSEWTKSFTPADCEKYLHRMGNLLLLARRKNSAAKNFEFTEKKKKYFAAKNGVTTFALTTQVINEPVWTPAVVQKRQEQLLAKLTDVWGLN